MASRMSCGSRGRWPFHGVTPVVLLLVLCLHLQDSASRCIDTAFGQDLQPLPPAAQRCSIPSGLLQPDVSPPGQGGGGGINAGDTRIVGGIPATSGGLAGGSSTGLPSSQGDSPFQYGKPGKPSQDGPGPVGLGSPVQYGGDSYGGPKTAFPIRRVGPRGFPRPEWKNPGIPYIPTARERGGGYILKPKESPQYFPNMVPYGGRAGSSYSGGQYSSTYSGGSVASGPRGSYDGSYGPIPQGQQPGGQRGGDSGERGPPLQSQLLSGTD